MLRTLSLMLLFTTPLTAQQPVPPDGPEHPFQDSLMGRLAGSWRMTGTMGTKPQDYAVQVDWIMNHQFLQFAMKDRITPPQYEATFFLGYDNASERYVAHLIDVFGGRWSETLGYGRREGNSVRFVFEYPEGPFHTVFTLEPNGDWRVDMTEKAASGQWRDFAHYRLVK